MKKGLFICRLSLCLYDQMSFITFIVYTLVALSSAIVVTKNSKQAVFITGDIGGSSIEIARKLCSYNIPVRALVPSNNAIIRREMDSIPLVTVFTGDSTDEESVQSCLSDCVAAVTMVNGKSDGDGTPQVDYTGNSNVIEQVCVILNFNVNELHKFVLQYFQAGILGVERIVLITSAGCGETKISVSDDFMKTDGPFIQSKNRAEKDLRMYTNLEWTIIRPGNVLTASMSKPTGKSILTTDIRASGDINAYDLSSLIVKMLLMQGNRFVRKEFSAFDPSLSASSISSSISDEVFRTVDSSITSIDDM